LAGYFGWRLGVIPEVLRSWSEVPPNEQVELLIGNVPVAAVALIVFALVLGLTVHYLGLRRSWTYLVAGVATWAPSQPSFHISLVSNS
jgi:hypothetical protein